MTDKTKLSKLIRLLNTDRFVIIDLARPYTHQSIEIEELLGMIEAVENEEDIAHLKKNLFESLKVPKEFLKENEE